MMLSHVTQRCPNNPPTNMNNFVTFFLTLPTPLSVTYFVNGPIVVIFASFQLKLVLNLRMRINLQKCNVCDIVSKI